MRDAAPGALFRARVAAGGRYRSEGLLVFAGFDAVLKYAQAACGRDASLLHASTERVVSSLGECTHWGPAKGF